MGQTEVCERCGSSTFRTELCVVARPADSQPRERIEAYLCYDCRQKTPHERLPLGGDA